MNKVAKIIGALALVVGLFYGQSEKLDPGLTTLINNDTLYGAMDTVWTKGHLINYLKLTGDFAYRVDFDTIGANPDSACWKLFIKYSDDNIVYPYSVLVDSQRWYGGIDTLKSIVLYPLGLYWKIGILPMKPGLAADSVRLDKLQLFSIGR